MYASFFFFSKKIRIKSVTSRVSAVLALLVTSVNLVSLYRVSFLISCVPHRPSSVLPYADIAPEVLGRSYSKACGE